MAKKVRPIKKFVSNNLSDAIKNAITFESLWLRSKSSYYMNIGNSYLNRASLLDERI